MRAISINKVAAIICFSAVTTGVANPSPPPQPASTAFPAKSPLREIGHVRARTTFCTAVYQHASAATSVALQNDNVLATTVDYLNRAELDESKMGKPNAIYDLQTRYATIMNAAHGAIDEEKVLRELADQAPTDEQKAALISYADAIGGALHRQELVAAYFRRFAMYLETHDAVSWQDHNTALFYAARTQLSPFEHSGDPRDRVPPTLTEVARSEAIGIADRHDKVLGDEVVAAGSADQAFGPCDPAPTDSAADSK